MTRTHNDIHFTIHATFSRSLRGKYAQRLAKVLICCIMAVASTICGFAQDHGTDTHKHKDPVVPPPTAWTDLMPLGIHQDADIDTLYLNYSRRAIPSAVSDAWVTTGNFAAQGTNMIWWQRPHTDAFFLSQGTRTYRPDVSSMKWYNSRIPVTFLSYNASGGRETAQERLKCDFSGNINRRAQVGILADYIYSKGSYANQALKDLIWGFSGSYMGDRYEFQGFYNHWNMLNKETGGITDDLYITDPAKLQGGVSSINAKSIPTNLTAAHTRTVGGQLYLNNRYKVGYWHEEQPSGEEGDTIVRRTYIPVTSFVWTLQYDFDKHLFLNSAPGEASKFFENIYLSADGTRDVTRMHALTNTVGVSLLEGFHRLAKFGLSAYFKHSLEKYYQTPVTAADASITQETTLDPLPEGVAAIAAKHSRSLAWVGGQLTKQRGSILTYEATGEVGLIGDAAGDVHIDGRVDTRFHLLGDSVSVGAYGRFDNAHAPYLLQNYVSNHFAWHNDFGKTRTLRVGGRVMLNRFGTSLDVGIENIQNHIYFDTKGLPQQHSGSVQVFSARLQQNFRVGALHWDNSLTYQTSTDENIITLPKFAVYTNLYATVRIATLRLQLGVDCNYYTSYYAPAYQPATAMFHQQRDLKLGNYPFMNVYANMKLSKARFYVMMSHVNQGWFGGNKYFSALHYPLNPRRFQIGVSVDFAN